MVQCQPHHGGVENLGPHTDLLFTAAALLLITQTWKQSKCPSLGECMKPGTQTLEYIQYCKEMH